MRRTPVPEPNNHTGETPLNPEQAQVALEQSIDRIDTAIATLEEAQRVREEIFELVVSV
jgi:hypothetical protein